MPEDVFFIDLNPFIWEDKWRERETKKETVINYFDCILLRRCWTKLNYTKLTSQLISWNSETIPRSVIWNRSGISGAALTPSSLCTIFWFSSALFSLVLTIFLFFFYLLCNQYKELNQTVHWIIKSCNRLIIKRWCGSHCVSTVCDV